MRSVFKFGTLSLIVAYFVACAPVKFESTPGPSCGGNGVACIQKCTGADCYEAYSLEKTVSKGKIDILIVNDNSGSMSVEQNKMGNAFNAFLSTIDQLDYRVGMITTDVSSFYTSTPLGFPNWPDANNGNGALQDGRLIEFSPGLKYITSSAQDSIFRTALNRPETAHCDSHGYAESECPSSDERGIFAASLAVESGELLRKDAALAVVILSDEDERGANHQGTETGNEKALADMYPLETRDKPDYFISHFKSLYPGKTLSVHSIIVPPGDAACKAAQTPGPTMIGREGFQYAKLSNLTGGIVGSICDSDFTTQLQDIGVNIQSQVLKLPFSCRPENDFFTLTATPAQVVTGSPDWKHLQLKINQHLAPGTKVKLTYKCKK